jgi:hypothetical protein
LHWLATLREALVSLLLEDLEEAREFPVLFDFRWLVAVHLAIHKQHKTNMQISKKEFFSSFKKNDVSNSVR